MKWTSPDPPLRYELVRLVEVVAIVGDHHARAHNLGAAGDLVASKHHLHLENSHLVKLKTTLKRGIFELDCSNLSLSGSAEGHWK